MKIRPEGADTFHADGRTDRRTDMMKLIAAFHSFTNVLKTPRFVDIHEVLCRDVSRKIRLSGNQSVNANCEHSKL
jgi:hypothetical protein